MQVLRNREAVPPEPALSLATKEEAIHDVATAHLTCCSW
jgi:hypothetical protein